MVFERSPVRRNDFDSSDDEETDVVENLTPFQVDWVDLSFTGCCAEVVCISGLPGCKYKDINRNLSVDIAHLKAINITDVFVFCSHREMVRSRDAKILSEQKSICLNDPVEQRCRVPYLVDEYSSVGFKVHHFPVQEGNVPTMADCSDMIEQLRQCISFGHRTLLHCVSGLGISCLAAAILLLSLDELMTPDQVISKLRQIRGQRAFQTVKQYNFVYEFRDLYKAHLENQRNSVEAAPRSLSR